MLRILEGVRAVPKTCKPGFRNSLLQQIFPEVGFLEKGLSTGPFFGKSNLSLHCQPHACNLESR